MDIPTILTLGLIVFINGWIVYYITYFKKKGEYQAIHEDIEEVTEKVELIKNKFNQETELIKADLNYLTQERISLSSEKRNTIIGAVDKYSVWLGTLMGVSANDLTESNVNEVRRKIESCELDFEISLSRLKLIVNSNKLNVESLELKMLTYEIQGLCTKALLELRANESQKEIYLKFNASNLDNAKHQGYLDKGLAIYKEYLNNRKGLSEKVLEKRQLWFDILRTELVSTLDKD